MVVRVYLKQAWNLMKQNPLFSTLYIVGTGISIVMTMVIAIVYYVRLAPVYPETNRMRTLVVKSAKMTNDESTHSANISYAMLKDWFYSLESAEVSTGVSGTSYARVTNDKEEIPTYARYTDENFFRVFPLVFLEGKPFTEADRRSGIHNVVLTDSYAQQLFGTTKGVVGKNFLMDYTNVKVVGVVKSGSFLTPDSYAQVYLPYSCREGYDDEGSHWALGGYTPVYHKVGKEIAGATYNFLDGETGSETGVVPVPGNYVFDVKRMHQFGLDSINLPKGAELINKTPGFYEQYKYWVIGVVAAFMFLIACFLIAVYYIVRINHLKDNLENPVRNCWLPRRKQKRRTD